MTEHNAQIAHSQESAQQLLYDTLKKLWVFLVVLALVPPFYHMNNMWSCGLWVLAATLLVVRGQMVRKYNQVVDSMIFEIIMCGITLCATTYAFFETFLIVFLTR